MANPKPLERQFRLGYILIILVLVFLGSKVSQGVISYKPDLQKQVLDMLTNLGVLVLVIERALEIYVSIWRSRGKITLEEDLAREEAKLAFAREHNKGEILLAQFEEMNKNLSDAKLAIEGYKDVTRTITLRVTLLIGIIISIAGFKVLDSLFINDTLSGLQLKIYEWADILLTAGVLSGGSAGIHSLSNTLGTFFDETTRKLKTPDN